MHEDVKCFDPVPVKIQLERRVVMASLGFSELFRKFYTTEVYSEVAQSSRRVYTHTYGKAKMIPSKFFFLAVCLELSLFPFKIFYYNGDATNEETKVGSKKVTGHQECSSTD